jgi:hypothetical protein
MDGLKERGLRTDQAPGTKDLSEDRRSGRFSEESVSEPGFCIRLGYGHQDRE